MTITEHWSVDSRIGNHYGTLEIQTEDGLFWWGIDDCFGMNWEKIDEELYRALYNHAKVWGRDQIAAEKAWQQQVEKYKNASRQDGKTDPSADADPGVSGEHEDGESGVSS